MKKPAVKPDSLCMVPWVHTYISPQTERRMCCTSREPSQNFKQYIDTKSSDSAGVYNPQTLEEWWNSTHMKEVRQQMMAGKTLSECEVCNFKLLNTHVYKDYFWQLFNQHYDKIWETTDDDGYTTMKPISWDYRFSNLCNFKCRMCGSMLSSSWEAEDRMNGFIDWDNPDQNWLRPEINKQIKDFQSTQVESEFQQAIEEHRVEEIYWVGGEPLMFDQHWKYMTRIIELGDAGNVHARYNTNLSRITYKNIHLWKDILHHFKDWQICASIDATGKIGEYIRTGLKWDEWLQNYKEGLTFQQHQNQMRLDLTITTPGLLDLKNMFDLSLQLNTQLLTKVTFAFSPDILMCPLALPKDILHPIIDDVLDYTVGKVTGHQKAFVEVLENMKTRQTFDEMWPDTYLNGLIKGKKRIIELEKSRKDCYTFENIMSINSKLEEWYARIRLQ